VRKQFTGLSEENSSLLKKDNLMKIKTINSAIKVVLLILILLGSYIIYDNYYSGETIKIANWNLNIFGQAKASDSELMNFYSSVIDDYDIIFVQEIRDKSGTAFPELCSMLQNYSCLSSTRAGRSDTKEQYGVIFKKWINLTNFYDYNPDSSDRWERPPLRTDFDINGYRLIIYNIHTKPEDAKNELAYLETVTSDFGNVIVLGDLNADCSYYDNKKEKEFDSWKWAISDWQDTTSSSTDCAYDRIILNSDASEEYKSAGIYRKGITKEISDHYPVWVEMKVD
jgi:endonuclease/exonuclease/phosphatase family metal-dependent hydrolase